jgi:hypothetical protein
MNIPSFHYNYTGKAGTWTYARNEEPNGMNLKDPWKTWAINALSPEQSGRLDKYLNYRSSGAKNDVLSYVKNIDRKDRNVLDFLPNLDVGKPIVLLAANIVWDAAALNKEIFFENMFEWVIETIKFFGAHPEWQLIVKPHPAETHPKLRRTNQRLVEEISKSGVHIPGNVTILGSEITISAYELYPLCSLGLIYTSTVGIELAIQRKPVIVAGKAPFRDSGFVVNPSTRKEYFGDIQDILLNRKPIDLDAVQELSRKYLYYYHFCYMIDAGIANYVWGERPSLKTKSVRDLLPGSNKYLDYVCESILRDLPIVSQNRWPPES